MAANARPAWMEKPSIPARAIKGIVLIAICVVMLFPFVYVVAVSFASERDVLNGGLILWPTHPSLDAYQLIMSNGIVARALIISVGITVVGTFISLFLTTTLAYALTRTSEVPGTKVALFMVLATLLFAAGIIPNYLLVKQIGLLNTYWALILPGSVSAFNLVVIRQFFMQIPRELLDSARMDGANELQVLWHFALPLSKAVLAVIALFYAVGLWNDYFNALLYLNDASMWPIQLVLRQYVLMGAPISDIQQIAQNPPPPQTIQMAVVVMATAPILIAYPFLQRYFTKGVLTGAIKG